MSRLKNAPLLEVIFELRWKMADKSHWEKYPYLHGDLYAQLKSKYPDRELLIPGEVPQEILENRAVYRFKHKNGYPLFQVGPGILTLNTTDDFYEWEGYSEQIKELGREFFKLYEFTPREKVSPTLSYYDFLPFDWEEEDVLAYISENLNIKIEQKFYNFKETPRDFNWGIGYKTAWGNFNLRIDAGYNKEKEKGLILQFRLNGFEKKPHINVLADWLTNGHTLCSNLFKELTAGKLYHSFN